MLDEFEGSTMPRYSRRIVRGFQKGAPFHSRAYPCVSWCVYVCVYVSVQYIKTKVKGQCNFEPLQQCHSNLVSETCVVIIGGIIYETPKLRDSQAGRGGCFPSFRVDRSHVNIAHLVVCNAKHTLVGSGTDDGLRRDNEKRRRRLFFS